jgi:hypothetical protein
MENNQLQKSLIYSLSIFLGLTTLGFFIFKGFKTFSDKDRIVTVKGLAEMNMKANESTISISFSFSGDELQEVINSTEDKKTAILAYLKKNGYSNSDIQVSNLNVTDNEKYYENQWVDGKEVQVKIDRYVIAQNIDISFKNVEQTEFKAADLTLDLVRNELTSKVTTSYSFPELNTIKPKLIAASTKNARISGEQFANDSQAKLGKIKTASQGQISIAGDYYYGDESESNSEVPKEPYIRKARVVSTIVFFLE